MRIIDTHAHIFPARIAQAAVNATNDFYREAETKQMHREQPFGHCLGTADDLLEKEHRAGVEQALVFSCATNVRQVGSVNTFIAEQCQSREGLMGAGTMFVGFPNMEEECHRILGLGLKGIKLHPDIQRFAIDDPGLFPLYEMMGTMGLFLIAHAGDYRFDYSGPKRVARVAEMFPGLKIIAAHFGGWSEWDEAADLLHMDNVYFDTSSTMPFAGKEMTLSALNRLDRTHIFFGTDYPMWNPETEVASILSLGLDDETLEGLFHANFERFLSSL